MTAKGRFAAGNVHAWAARGRRVAPDAIARLRAARERPAIAAVLRDLGSADGTPAGLFLGRLERLMADYDRLARTYPVGRELLLALGRLHELENLKLVVRACARELPAERWFRLWRPLGRLETLRAAACREIRALPELAAAAAGTPYRDLVAEVIARPAVAEPAADRWATARLDAEARRLPPAERSARELVLALLRERELLTARGAAARGVAGERDAALLSDASLVALRRARRDACRRAFLGGPFRLAPAVAALLLEEEELRALTALAEAAGADGHDGAVARALAAAEVGS